MPNEEVVITRETFMVDIEHQGARNAKVMYVYSDNPKDPSGLKQVEVPETVIRTGLLPEGFCIDLALDPLVVVESLRKQGTIYESQLSSSLLKELQQAVCAPENMNIVPIQLYKDKMEAVAASLNQDAEEEN